MYEILKSSTFDSWLRGLRDRDAKAKVEVRIRRLSLGNPGQFRSLKDGINELKIDYGPGYRVYFAQKGNQIMLLLAGGDKTGQDKAIKEAQEMLESLIKEGQW